MAAPAVGNIRVPPTPPVPGAGAMPAGPGIPRAAAARLSQRSRVQYKTFKGRAKHDPDEWLEEFEGITQANGESGTNMQILNGLFKGEALAWYLGLNNQIKGD